MCAPAGTVWSDSMTPSGSNGAKNSRIFASGENRQSSCEVVGSGNAFGSREVNRSEGVPVGPAPCECGRS